MSSTTDCALLKAAAISAGDTLTSNAITSGAEDCEEDEDEEEDVAEEEDEEESVEVEAEGADEDEEVAGVDEADGGEDDDAEEERGEEDGGDVGERVTANPASIVVFSFGCATPGVASVLSSSSTITSL